MPKIRDLALALAPVWFVLAALQAVRILRAAEGIGGALGVAAGLLRLLFPYGMNMGVPYPWDWVSLWLLAVLFFTILGHRSRTLSVLGWAAAGLVWIVLSLAGVAAEELMLLALRWSRHGSLEWRTYLGLAIVVHAFIATTALAGSLGVRRLARALGRSSKERDPV